MLYLLTTGIVLFVSESPLSTFRIRRWAKKFTHSTCCHFSLSPTYLDPTSQYTEDSHYDKNSTNKNMEPSRISKKVPPGKSGRVESPKKANAPQTLTHLVRLFL